MAIRGIGDTAGIWRLLLLFGGTVFVPTVLAFVLFLGAVGHEQWTAAAIATREVEVQVPLLRENLLTRLSQIDLAVARLDERCPDGTCEPPMGVASLETDDPRGWTPDIPWLQSWCNEHLVIREDSPMGVVIEPLSNNTRGVPLAGALDGYQLRAVDKRTLTTGAAATTPVADLIVIGLLLGLVVVGGSLSLRAAAREIRMSQRQVELVGRVSHELRTPMTAIRMFVDTLESGRMGPEQSRECLHLLGQESERLSRRIEEVLSWARMEAGARRYTFGSTTAHRLLGEALAAYRGQTLLENIEDEIVLDIPDDLPELTVDHDAIVEALLNLIANAHRYTPSPRRITLSAKRERWMIGLSIGDNGPGIAQHELRRVFEKFYRAGVAEDPAVTQGTGLGLAIVRAIVRDHGGRVDLDSVIDEGSTFTIWLPLVPGVLARSLERPQPITIG